MSLLDNLGLGRREVRGVTRGTRDRVDDQTRVVTPADALAAGSSYLVIGRPIYQAEDPRQAAEEIARSLF